MTFDFDQPIERRQTESMKWRQYGEDVLPMWVADMDFRSPEPVVRALRERAEHGVFGYALQPPPELATTVCEWLDRRYQWSVTPDQLLFFPGVVASLNTICRLAGPPGSGVLVHTPAYPPFLGAPGSNERVLQAAELPFTVESGIVQYGINYESFEEAITPDTRLFVLCHPHNPIGREWTRDELTGIAEICLRHDLLICSDEIHCDLLLGGTRHTPLASLAAEIADRCITLMAPSKSFNVPGLGLSFAVVSNGDLRKRLKRAAEGTLPLVNAMGCVAALAAYRDGAEWLEGLNAYLTANRDALAGFVVDEMPRLATTVPEATYLAWLDCREAGIEGGAYEFFLKEARVALSNGAAFGPGGQGFVRLNFGCPRSQLMLALERMRDALDNVL